MWDPLNALSARHNKTIPILWVPSKVLAILKVIKNIHISHSQQFVKLGLKVAKF